MTDQEIKQSIVDTGKKLLDMGLVARTWGNISCRKDDTHFAISPSGMSYLRTTVEDVPIFDTTTEEYEGTRKPSSEKRIHAAAYEIYKDVNFVIHTHQDYATAIGLVSACDLEMTDEEKKVLGKILIAGYGLPGTKTLKNNVAVALQSGAKVVLMIHHGALICGTDPEDTIKKSLMLEEVCKRTIAKKIDLKELEDAGKPDEEDGLLKDVKAKYPNLLVNTSPIMKKFAEGKGFRAQVDDMAQMIGPKLKCVKASSSKAISALEKQDAVLVKGVGCLINSVEKDDAEALGMLLNKAAICKSYTLKCNVNGELPRMDCKLMHVVYKMKYSKKK